MADREKVIWGLRCCRNIHIGATLDDSCNQCPYQKEKGRTCVADELFHDAIALLKAQEPRVITLEEALGGDECWVEYPNGGCGYADCYLSYGGEGADICRTMQHDFNVPLTNYGRTWRCWTSRPTDEQREATSWDDT